MASKKAKPLLLANEAHGQEKSWRAGESLIDSLAYTDPLDDTQRAQVEELIKTEMLKSDKTLDQYLADLPPLPLPQRTPHLATEMERVARGEPLPPLDVSRYRLDPPPPTKRSDYTAWQSSLNNAQSQLEHQYNRLLNLELMTKYGPNVWRAHNSELEQLIRSTSHDVEQVKAEMERINAERKIYAEDATRTMEGLERSFYRLVEKNLDIERAVLKLEREANRRGVVVERGGEEGMET